VGASMEPCCAVGHKDAGSGPQKRKAPALGAAGALWFMGAQAATIGALRTTAPDRNGQRKPVIRPGARPAQVFVSRADRLALWT
jgi:hypothetical protein